MPALLSWPLDSIKPIDDASRFPYPSLRSHTFFNLLPRRGAIDDRETEK